MTRYGFLSTYPPTRCGLATFTDALSRALQLTADEPPTIVRVLDEPEARSPGSIPRSSARTDLIAGDARSAAHAAIALKDCDVAIVQHEYGIYGGRDGAEVLDVLAAVRTPTIVVLHTVLPAPTPHQRHVLQEVCRLATAVVVMTLHARETLAAHYTTDLARVHVIPHGVSHLAVHDVHAQGTRRVLTWGLISPGKGIEWGIRAIAELADLVPPVEYVVAGQTHPKVLARTGEAYREMLGRLVDELGLDASVRLDGRYLDSSELAALMASADVVLLPYDTRDQVTSGVLTEAVAAGIPVVATGFPHATELLADGAGIVVAHEDPSSIARALRLILTGDDVAGRMREAALRNAESTAWPEVAKRYRALAAGLVSARAA